MIKECATSLTATVHPQSIPGIQNPTTQGKVFTKTQILVLG